MPYGIIKVDQVTFTNAGADQTISVSGIVASISGNITATGTISGDVIRGGTTVSGATVTGTAGQFGTITGNTAGFTTVTGTTVTGVTATFTSGVFALGSASNPSISFTSDPNTGIYSPGADQVAISTNGSGRLFVDASGNLNVKKTAAALSNVGFTAYDTGRVDITANGATPLFVNRLTSNGELISFYKDTVSQGGIKVSGSDFEYAAYNAGALLFSTNATERLRITSAGLVGIGTSSPGALLDISGSGNIVRLGDGTNTFDVRFKGPNNWTTQLDTSADKFNIQRNSTSLVTVDGAGRLGIGTTSPGAYSGQLVINISPSGDHLVFADDSTSSGAAAARLGCSGNNLVFKTNSGSSAATERARIDSSGRLLVGTSTSTSNSKFQVQGNSDVATGAGVAEIQYGSASPASGTTIGALRFKDTTVDTWYGWILCESDAATGAADKPGRLVFSTTADGASSPTERMRIDNKGDVGIGITPSAWGGGGGPRGVNFGATGVLFNINSGSFLGDNWYFNGTNDVRIGAGYASRFICTSSGRCATATTGTSTAGSTITWTDGPYVANGGTSWTNSSDERLKTITGEISNGLDRVSQLRAAEFYWKSDKSQKQQVGLIAQDLLQVLPEVVVIPSEAEEEEGYTTQNYMGVNYDQVIPLLVAALKESKERIEQLEAKVAALESA